MVTYKAQCMLHRKQDPQDMETIQDYRHTQARERLRNSEELQTNLPLMPYVQTSRTNDYKQNSPSSWTMPNQGTSRLQDREVMHQPTVEHDPTHWRRLPERHDHWCSLHRPICCLRHSEPYNPNTETLQHNSRQPTMKSNPEHAVL